MMIVTMPPVALLALAFVHVRDSNTNLTFYRSKSRIKRFILAMLNWRSSKTDSKVHQSQAVMKMEQLFDYLIILKINRSPQILSRQKRLFSN